MNISAFISYSHLDKIIVSKFLKSLPSYISHWFDENDAKLGLKIEDQINKALDVKVDYFIVFVSQNSLKSNCVRKEIKIAQDKNLKIVPVIIDDLSNEDENYLEGFGLAYKLNKTENIKEQANNFYYELKRTLCDEQDKEFRIKYKKINSGGLFFSFTTFITAMVVGVAGGFKHFTIYQSKSIELFVLVSIISFSFTFPVSNYVNHRFGKYAAEKLVKMGMYSLCLSFVIIALFVIIPSGKFAYQKEYEIILLPSLSMILASPFAVYFSHSTNIKTFNFIKRNFSVWITPNMNNLISSITHGNRTSN